MDRQLLLDITRELQLDYTGLIDVIDLTNIILKYNSEATDEMIPCPFYIEELKSEAGYGSSYMYLDYYDTTLKKIIMVEELNYQLDPELDNIKCDEDVVDYLLLLQAKVITLEDKIRRAFNS